MRALMDAHDGDDQNDRSLLSVLLAARVEGQRLGRRQLLDEITVMLTLGAHQTALALCWALEMVARHPEIQRALAVEAETEQVETIHDAGWHRLVLARQVIEDTLRLRPPFYVFARQTRADLTLSAHVIPAGRLVIVSPWLTHRDERYFAEPERFRPERWTAAARRARPRCAYLPFGAGPRVCLAQGLMTMHLT
jgi:cytochrome P450